MKIFVIFATFVACCYAAPAADLQHPSPINPSVLVEIKPEERVILMTDPQEIAKFKRETNQPLYPTVLPEDHQHHIAKRDHKPGHETKPDNKPNSQAPPKKSPPHPPTTTTKKPAQKPHSQPAKQQPPSNKRNRRDVEALHKPQTLPAYGHHGLESPQGIQKPQTLPATLSPEQSSQGFQKPQTLPAILTEPSKTALKNRRDIPVPLVPKYQHPEVSPKESSEEKSDEDDKEDKKEKSSEEIKKDKKETSSDHVHHAHHQHKDEVQVEDLSEHKPLHQTLNFNHDIHTDDKTDNDEKKPNISDDHLDADQVTSPTEHHLSRPKPVPVAELFAKAHHDN